MISITIKVKTKMVETKRGRKRIYFLDRKKGQVSAFLYFAQGKTCKEVTELLTGRNSNNNKITKISWVHREILKPLLNKKTFGFLELAECNQKFNKKSYKVNIESLINQYLKFINNIDILLKQRGILISQQKIKKNYPHLIVKFNTINKNAEKINIQNITYISNLIERIIQNISKEEIKKLENLSFNDFFMNLTMGLEHITIKKRAGIKRQGDIEKIKTPKGIQTEFLNDPLLLAIKEQRKVMEDIAHQARIGESFNSELLELVEITSGHKEYMDKTEVTVRNPEWEKLMKSIKYKPLNKNK